MADTSTSNSSSRVRTRDVKPLVPQGPELVFYDGHCGLCHRIVRFLLTKDTTGDLFHFAPLKGETFQAVVPESLRETLPDSLLVQTVDGTLLTRSDAMLHVLRRLGGVWKMWGISAGLIPRVLRDGIYDWIAHIRYRLFRAPLQACPLVPAHLRARFKT